MKQSLSLLAFLCVASAPLLYSGPSVVQASDIITYSPGMWRNGDIPAACGVLATGPKDTVVFNYMSLRGNYPLRGYPLRGALYRGVNDTIQIGISWMNRTDKPYSLVGKDVTTWFEPKVFRNDDRYWNGMPWRDTDSMGFRIRGWYSTYDRPMAAEDTLPAHLDGQWSIWMDIWKLTEGDWSICVLPTDKVAKGFSPRAGGDSYQMRTAQDLADSTNAYEACFWRCYYDMNYSGARTWASKITMFNPKSVPGWWLRAQASEALGDTTAAKAAYDSALVFLNTNQDPAMPDTLPGFDQYIRVEYRHWCDQMMSWARKQYGP